METVILFTTDCPRCKVLEKKLEQKNISFILEHNVREIINQGFMSAPVLKVNNKYMDFGSAVQWIQEI